MKQNQQPKSVFQALRNRSPIDPQELSEFVFGSKERLELYNNFSKKMEEVSQLTPAIFEMSRHEAIFHKMQESQRTKLIYTNNVANDKLFPFESLNTYYIHYAGLVGQLMSGSLITFMATDEQKSAWLPAINKYVWISCYCQTELSHGLDFNSVKTMASFDLKTQEFVIHTPTNDAMKWWPGDLSIYSNHCLLMAQLYSNGKNYGVQPFFFKFRDLETHEVLPGVEVGDIGPKMGYNFKDNGFLRYKINSSLF